MYVTEFELESFCGGPPLRFLDLGNGLNVALAPSTDAAEQLLQVIPGTLFGDARFFSKASSKTLDASRRTAVLVRTEDGAFRVERSWGVVDPPGVVTTGDGQFIDVHRWDAHRARVSAAEYADVFTFDVRRLRRLLQNPRRAIQALQALARELDDMSVTQHQQSIPARHRRSDLPLDGVIAELSRLKGNLAHSIRNELAPGSDQNGRSEQEQPSDALRRAELALRDVREQLANAERESDQLRTALMYLPVRDRLAALERELAELPNRMAIGGNVAADESIKQLEERIALVKSEWKEIRAERATLADQRKEWAPFQKIDEIIPQLEAALWQGKPHLREEDALGQLKDRIEELEKQSEHDRREAQARPQSFLTGTAADVNSLAKLDALSDRLRDAERERDVADQALAKAEAMVSVRESSEYSVVGATGPAARHDAEVRVARLRDQLDSRDDVRQLRQDREQLDQQVRQLYREQLLPLPTVLAFGVPFALGAALIIHALMARVDAVNWQQILWGFVIAFVTVLVKILRDRERDRMLMSARRRLAGIDEQLAEFEDEIPEEEGEIATPLQVAERDLQERAADANQRALDAARRRSSDASAKVRDLAQQWRTWMVDLSLSPSLTPTHAREALAERARRESEAVSADSGDGLDAELRSLRKEWERRQESLNHQVALFRRLAKETGHSMDDASIGAITEHLRQVVRDAKERKLQRDQSQRTDRRLRQRETDIRKNGRRLIRQCKRMREEATRRREHLQAQEKQTGERREQLIAVRDRLQREANTLLGHASLEPDGTLAALSESELIARVAAKAEELATLREQVIRHAEQQGQLRGQLEHEERAEVSAAWNQAWNAIRPVVDDLESLHNRVRSLAERSRATSRDFADEMLHESRFVQIAARHLKRLSNGEYSALALRGTRRQLVCGDRQGRWRSLSNLQVAQYANVYFALWLARLEQYAARGIRFPIILQDPLMITSTSRKSVFARTLKQTAAKGHQMLLVTNLPRNASVLAELGVPIADVADRHALTHSATAQSFGHQARSAAGESTNPRIGGDPTTDTFLTLQ